MPALSMGDVSLTEADYSNMTMTFTVSLSPASGRNVSMSYATVGDAQGVGSINDNE